MEYLCTIWCIVNHNRQLHNFEKEEILIEGLLFGLDFFGHALMYGLAAFFGFRLFKNKPFMFRAIILFSLLNAVGVYYELFQGVVRDWLYDIIANNLGIVVGLVYARRKYEHGSEKVHFKSDSDYLRSSVKRRLYQRKKEL